jgi:hypothetical protein
MEYFKPKIPIWVNSGGSCKGRYGNILLLFGLFYGQLVNPMAIWYILWSFGIFCPVLVLYQEKSGNPAP